jgi:DNA-binding GntR family transcriptional regulator
LLLHGKPGITLPVAIDRSRPLPPYLQLAQAIRDRVASGDLAPGERLPSVLALADEFDVAPVTVQKALRILKSEGLVVAYQGHGTFIAETP